VKANLQLVIGGFGALIVLVTIIWLFHANNLGLTGFDTLVGRRLEMGTIRANTKAAADSFLSRHETDLVDENDRNSELVLDYSKSSQIRSLGYRSSFYYYCWDIYLPYSLRTNSVDIGTVIVQLSDAVEGHHHDPTQFHVIHVMLVDGQGKVTKTIDQSK
jgi:hypothetical protein